MTDWREALARDPIEPLLGAEHEPIRLFTRRDLLGEDPGEARALWGSKEARKVLRKQATDGSWEHPGKNAKRYPDVNYRLFETFKKLGAMLDRLGMDRTQPTLAAAAEYLFSCQTGEGDFRGILAGQYAPYYTGLILGRLIRAGYAEDPRVAAGIRWLVSVRQKDGGWMVPIQGLQASSEEQARLTTEQCSSPVPFDRALPSAHSCTGMAIRALACHPTHRLGRPARRAGELLKERFFKPDRYSSYKAAGYWLKFQYPFWWNSLLSALDSMARMGFARSDPDVGAGLGWFVDHQQEDGTWKTAYALSKGTTTRGAREEGLWITLAVCRMFQRFHQGASG